MQIETFNEWVLNGNITVFFHRPKPNAFLLPILERNTLENLFWRFKEKTDDVFLLIQIEIFIESKKKSGKLREYYSDKPKSSFENNDFLDLSCFGLGPATCL